jgi:1-acyl-sn-glycerol-3-phosphate acyltransferase
LVQLLAIGSVVGSLLAAVQWHPCRGLSLVPVGATGLTVSLLCLVTSSGLSVPTFCVLAGVVLGLTEVPLRAAWLLAVPLDARSTGIALFQAAGVVRAALVLILLRALYLFQVAGEAGVAPPGSARRHLWLLLLLLGVWAVACSRLFIREWAEQVTELLLTPFSRVHTHGREHFPLQGPCIVLANHAAWFDPLWLTKEVPRRVTPLMISLFYDRPIIHWLMVHVVQAIRVPAANFRREAPELKEAIAVLDRDGCVMIFPEGWLRRRDDQLLRPFGQGIWRILRERPATPVVACWIEGGWGSFTSFYNGPPMTNKRLDRRRRVDIVFGNPEVLNPSLLADQRATRNYLMRACLELRSRCLRPGKGAATP